MKQVLLKTFLVFIVMYLATSFVNMDFNLSNWHYLARYAVIYITLIYLAVQLMINNKLL